MGLVTWARRRFVVPAVLRSVEKALGLKGGSMNFLKGYVTYIAAIGGAATAVAAFLTGNLPLKEFIEALVAALSVFGLRRAIGGAK